MSGEPKAPASDSRLKSLIAQVRRENLERDVRYLSTAWGNRHTFGKNILPCANWLTGRFRDSGLRDVARLTYSVGGHSLPNVVATKPGHAPETIIVCAHFDSRMQNLADSEAPAPGADDNGTGVAVVLELARLLAPLTLGASLRFCLFSGEEQNCLGSTAYVAQVKAEKAPIRFVFNLDELGYPPPDRAIFVDRDEGRERRENDAAGHALVERIQALARNVVKVPTRVDPAEDSDYDPFEAQGYVIAGLYEAGKNYPAYHTSMDTFEKVDFAYVTDMARLALATVYSEALM